MNSKLLEIALSQYGITEIVGKKHNPEVLKYFSDTGFMWVKDDETAWCSAFANWCASKANLSRSKKLNARSWLDVGEEVKTIEEADIVVYWRESRDSWKGHVGFPIAERGNSIYTLGGNQKNKVCIQAYPSTRRLSYRKLHEL